jgi:hypothetical protein
MPTTEDTTLDMPPGMWRMSELRSFSNHWKDTFWGVYNGVGKNMLGKLLMQVREELQNVES